MLDNPLFILIRANLIIGLVARGLSDVVVQQANQPTQQGQPSARTIYFVKSFERRHGSPKSSTIYDAQNIVRSKTDKQMMETTFQFSATVTPDPASITELTAADLLKTLSSIVQHDSFQIALAASNVGIMRVTDIREPKVRSDRMQFKVEPSFDLIVTHRDVFTIIIPTIDTFNAEVIGV